MRNRTSLAAVILFTVVLTGSPSLVVAQNAPADPPAGPAAFASASTSATAAGPAPAPVIGPAAATSAAAPAAGSADAPAGAAGEAERREWFGSSRRWADWTRATGDWGTWRNRLEARGVTVTLGTTTDGSHPLAGSTRGIAVARTLLDAGVEWDLDRSGLGAGRLFVGYQRKAGGEGASCVEDGQGFSNIDAPDFRGVAEVWYERPLGAAARIKLGVIDANSEFAFVENGAEFLNSSMGYSPSIFPMPTYPDPQPGLVVQATPTAWSYIGAGVYDGGLALELDRFHAVFAISEAGLRWSRAGGGRVGVGAWHTRSLRSNAETDQATTATSGQYVVLDQTVWSDGADDGGRRIAAFAQLGMADRLVSPVARHVGAGVVATGLVPRRAQDSVGVSVTAVTFGRIPDCPEGGGTRETNIGAFYKWHLTGWLALKPDVQWIIHPTGDLTRASAVVATLRLDIGF